MKNIWGVGISWPPQSWIGKSYKKSVRVVSINNNINMYTQKTLCHININVSETWCWDSLIA